MVHQEEKEFVEFLSSQKKEAAKRVVFWLLVVIAVTSLVISGVFPV